MPPVNTTTALFRMSENVGNTTQMLLNMAKSLLENGDKIFNSNLVLRRSVANDMIAAKSRVQLKEEVPNLSRDIELAENILSKFRMAGGTENQAAIQNLYGQFENATKQADVYSSQRDATAKQLQEFSKTHMVVVQTMINEIVKTKSPTYDGYLRSLKEQRQVLSSIQSSINMLKKEGAGLQIKIMDPARTAIGIMRTLQKPIPGGIPSLDQNAAPRLDE